MINPSDFLKWLLVFGVETSPTSAAGVDGNIQYNDNGAFGANPNFNFDEHSILIGYTTSLGAEQVQVTGVATTGAQRISTYSNNTNPAVLRFMKSRSAVPGVQVTLQNGDFVSLNSFYGDDGTSFIEGARIAAQVSSAPSTGIVPMKLKFATMNASGLLADAMVITENQVVTLTFALPSSSGGTGVNNGASTITLGGSLTTSGAFASTFTMTAATSVTFPTSGTLATTAQVMARAPIPGTTQSAAVNTIYVASNASQTTLTLPATYAVGDIIGLVGSTANTGGWIIATASGDTIRLNNTTGASSGTLTSGALAGQCVELMCDVANTSWVVRNGTYTTLTLS